MDYSQKIHSQIHPHAIHLLLVFAHIPVVGYIVEGIADSFDAEFMLVGLVAVVALVVCFGSLRIDWNFVGMEFRPGMASRCDFICHFAIDNIDFDIELVVGSFAAGSLYACCQQILLEAVKVNSYFILGNHRFI